MILNKYKETTKRLIEKIRNNLVKVIERENFNSKFKSDIACYFCRKKIKGKVRILVYEDSKGGTNYYPIDGKCYAKAKGIEVV